MDLFCILAQISGNNFGTRYANADREIFENSKPFIHGSIENLNRLRLAYQLADNEKHKNAIRVMVYYSNINIRQNKTSFRHTTMGEFRYEKNYIINFNRFNNFWVIVPRRYGSSAGSGNGKK